MAIINMSSSLDHKCQRCGSEYHGQICPFCTITGLDVNALLASEGLTMPAVATADPPDSSGSGGGETGEVTLIDVISNRSYPINNAICRFGRDISNDIVLTGDKSLSRFHFQVTIVNNEYFVEDAGSRNGSFLNGAPVTAPKKLVNGDVISAGMSRYRFVNGVDLGGGELDEEEQAQHAQAQLDDPKAGSDLDPLMRIMQEGQALLGDPDESSDFESFFKNKDGNGHVESESEPKLGNFFQLERPKETPIDELFQQQMRAAAAAKDQEDTAAAAVPVKTTNFEPAAVEQDLMAEPPVAAINRVPQTQAPVPVEELYPAETAAEPQMTSCTQEETKVECNTVVQPREWPGWCTDYTFPEIADIKSSMTKLETEIKERQAQLNKLGVTVSETEDIRNRMLATQDAELLEACSVVFRMLGFAPSANGTSNNELVLSADGAASGIAKVVSTDSQPRPADLASLISSLSTYWCDHGVEPKGILVVSMMQEGNPDKRAPFSKDFVDYAVKKNVCLISTVQLLAIYRDISLRAAKVESIRAELLSANGQLSGFEPVTPKRK